MLDLNDAEPQRSSDLIPDGSFVKVSMLVRPGGADGPGPMDAGLLKASNQPGSDVLSLDCEFTVVEGPHIRRKFWQLLTVSGGKVDEKGISVGWSITKRTIRGMIESALGLNPKDESADAKAKRTLPSLNSLNGIVFVAKVRVKSDNYGEQNQLDIAVTPDLPEWAKVMKGEDVPPRPGQRRAPKGAAQANTGPAWQTHTAAAPAGGPQTAAPRSAPVAASAAAPAWQQGQPAPAAHVAPQRAGPAWLNE